MQVCGVDGCWHLTPMRQEELDGLTRMNCRENFKDGPCCSVLSITWAKGTPTSRRTTIELLLQDH